MPMSLQRPSVSPPGRPGEGSGAAVFVSSPAKRKWSSAMQLTVTGKQVEVGNALRSHVESALEGLLGKYFGTAIEPHPYKLPLSSRIDSSALKEHSKI